MFITIINDSSDDNAKVRQVIRWSVLFPEATFSFIGVNSNLGDHATLEAAGNLIDVLDASSGQDGIIALNVAPRGQLNDGKNGSVFCYFWYKKTLVISTVKKFNLSLVKKFRLTEKINLLDLKKTLSFAKKNNLISKQQENYITNTQFRSYDFQPRVARWLKDKINIPHTKVPTNNFPDCPRSIWLIDSFGNAKLTLTTKELKNRKTKKQFQTNLGKFRYYERLKDVPQGETAIYTGSSGIGNHRFLEIATQNTKGSAANKLNLKVGRELKFL